MTKQKQMLVWFLVIPLLVGCKRKAETAGEGSTSPGSAPTATAETPANPAAAESPTLPPTEPPTLEVGLSVEQAYAAIPHRRTVWVEADSPLPADDKAYLRVIFALMDQGVAARVAGEQSFMAGRFDSSDPAANYDRLIDFARGMPVPPALTAYHQKILDGLAGQRQFFADWKAAGAQFQFAQQIGGHPGVRNASSALRAAYNELMAKYPNETPTNKDAFFDYHCALDFL